MKYRPRVFFTDKQKSEIWDRWQRGESMSSIGRGFDRGSSSIYPLLARTGGIRPPDRMRSRLALTLIDREEISRGLRAKVSLRSIARAKVRGVHLAMRGPDSSQRLNNPLAPALLGQLNCKAGCQMSRFNEITKWSSLAKLAGGRLPKLTILAPFVAFIILHNEPLQPFLNMSENWHPNPLVEKAALARFDIFYVGLVVVGIAVAIFSLFSPSQVTSHSGYDAFIEFKERTKTNNGIAGSLRLTLDEFSKLSKRTELDFDAKERRYRFPRRFREGLWSLMRAISRTVEEAEDAGASKDHDDPHSIMKDLLSESRERPIAWESLHTVFPHHSIDIFRLEFIRADYSSPFVRGAVFWLLICGLIVAFVPTMITTHLVVSDLFRVLSQAPSPN
jgi:hypothetical protein